MARYACEQELISVLELKMKFHVSDDVDLSVPTAGFNMNSLQPASWPKMNFEKSPWVSSMLLSGYSMLTSAPKKVGYGVICTMYVLFLIKAVSFKEDTGEIIFDEQQKEMLAASSGVLLGALYSTLFSEKNAVNKKTILLQRELDALEKEVREQSSQLVLLLEACHQAGVDVMAKRQELKLAFEKQYGKNALIKQPRKKVINDADHGEEMGLLLEPYPELNYSKYDIQAVESLRARRSEHHQGVLETLNVLLDKSHENINELSVSKLGL